MSTSLHHGYLRTGNTVSRAFVSLRDARLTANFELLLGLLIIPTLNGVVLIA